MKRIFRLRQRRWWTALAAGWLCAGGVSAGPDLYQAAVPVSGQTQEDRNGAIAKAMEKVLVKITGSRSVAAKPGAAELVRAAPSLVQQYRYESLPNVVQGDTEVGKLLAVRFDESALRQALRDRGLPAWGSSRPTLLLWLGVEEQRRRRFVQTETDVDLQTAVTEVADDRGMSFLFPLMDVEDLARIQASDLWGGFEGRVSEASARYGADVVLVGRVSPARRSNRVDWQMQYGERSETWQSRADTPARALADGLQEAVDRIAARFAPVENPSGADAVLVRVRGLDDLQSYVRVDRFFAGMDGVEQSAAVHIEPDQVLFRVRIRGGVDALSRTATLGHLLIPEPLAPGSAAAPGAGPAPDLGFRLIR